MLFGDVPIGVSVAALVFHALKLNSDLFCTSPGPFIYQFLVFRDCVMNCVLAGLELFEQLGVLVFFVL